MKYIKLITVIILSSLISAHFVHLFVDFFDVSMNDLLEFMKFLFYIALGIFNFMLILYIVVKLEEIYYEIR